MRSTRQCTTQKRLQGMVGLLFCVVFALLTPLFAESFQYPTPPIKNGDVADTDQVQSKFDALKVAVDSLEVGRDTQGLYNTVYGRNALYRNTTGGNNLAVGAYALYHNTTGDYNLAVGNTALRSNTTGLANTASGVNALYSNTTGFDNTAFGFEALMNNTTGSGNIAVGSGAGESLTSGDNNIYLGNPGTAAESNTMHLGGGQTRTFIAGIAGVPVSGSAVFISPTGQLGIQPSAARYKRDIQPMGARSRGLLQLRPVTFRYTQGGQGERQYGLIAEEVAKVYPELVTRGAKGEVESIRYQDLTPMLLNELQHQQRQLAELKTQNAELRAQNARLQAAVGQLQEREAGQQTQYAALAARLERLEAVAARAATLSSR